MNNQYNVFVDLIGAFLIGTILLIRQRRQRQRGDLLNARLLYTLMYCCAAVFVTDIPGLLLDGRLFPGAHTLLWFLDSAYWMLQIIYAWLWLLLADYWTFGSRERLKKRVWFYALPMLAELGLILTTPLTGWVFVIDAQNVYARGSFYLPNMLFYVFYIAAALYLSMRGYLRCVDPERKRRSLSLMIYMFLPVCGVVLDAFVYGISWLWPMVALSLLMVYLNVQQQNISEEQLSTARLEAELTESRVVVMLSQIQPHFLYNALNTVDALCGMDPKAAQVAVRSFAKYLRGNLDALTRRTPIPFREELAHMRQYLTLEQFRFENIDVSYDLETEDFMLPALTLQPIVENAVKYGVLKRENGGSIFVSTRDGGDCVLLTVRDDGVGFDPSHRPEDGRSHIGIENVRRRLEAMCGGTLTVESAPDAGTTVTYRIPKGGLDA